jgi:hypothetical protein
MIEEPITGAARMSSHDTLTLRDCVGYARDCWRISRLRRAGRVDGHWRNLRGSIGHLDQSHRLIASGPPQKGIESFGAALTAANLEGSLG